MTPPTSPLPPGGSAPPAKKSNALLWILLGVGGFFVLIVVVAIAGGLFIVHKARQAGQFELKSGDGTIQIGGSAKTPTWVPDYPGSNPQTAFSAQGKDGRSGTFVFNTKDSAEHVAQFYRDQLESSGLTVSATVNSGSSQVITAADHTKHRTLTVVVSGGHDQTEVSVTYANK